jgi:hypothetical protein
MNIEDVENICKGVSILIDQNRENNFLPQREMMLGTQVREGSVNITIFYTPL